VSVKAERATVLVVDDELGPRESLRTVLGRDYQVLTATEGAEALKILGETLVDIVLLDLKMPGLSGTRVLEQIKGIDSDIEVIIVTGYASYDSLLEGLRLQVFDYVAKPFDVPQLLALVKRAIDRRKSRTWLRRVREEILAHLSHELRTPLNAIVGYSALLDEELGPKLDEDQRLVLQRLHIGALGLTSIIANLLYLTQLETRDIPFTITQVNLKTVAGRVVEKLQAEMDRVGVKIHAEVPDAVALFTDERQLEKLLEVFLYRALRTVAPGHILIQAEEASGRAEVEIVITDTRVGLSEEERAFLRASEQKEEEGLLFQNIGLGLVVALVRHMRGSLSVKNGANQGTTFRILLPMK
jgi:signal transduction histidine kinase